MKTFFKSVKGFWAQGVKRRSRNPAIAPHDVHGSFETGKAVVLQELIKAGNVFLHFSRFKVFLRATDAKEVFDELGRNCRHGGEHALGAHRAGRDHVLIAAEQLKLRSRALDIGDDVDHELPVHARVDEASEIARAVDQLQHQIGVDLGAPHL